MHVVPTVSTPISAEHARDALRAAMPGIDRDSASLLLALIWVETGRGNVLNNNVGNITAGASYAGSAWLPPWYSPSSDPHLAELHDRMLKGTAPSAFRAYDSAPEGFADFARVLHSQFPTVLQAAASGSPAAFVVALHDSGYSRDYNLSHVATFDQLRDFFKPLVASLPASSGGGGTELAGGAFTLLAAWFAVRAFKRHQHRRHS